MKKGMSKHAAPVRRAIYPGSFDPITLGHLDVIARAARLFDEVLVAVAGNESKRPLFSMDERVGMIEQSVEGMGGVRVCRLDGLLADFAAREGVAILIRGLRAVSDFEYEFQMALMNRRLNDRLETVFLTPSEAHTFLSSRLVKEVARLGGEVSQFVPGVVAGELRAKFA